MASHWELLHDCIPSDHARQVNSRYYIDEAMTAENVPDMVMDLGCGIGASLELFASYQPNVRWVGVDIVGSPESAARENSGPVVMYDGVRLPFADASVPLIYSHQVFEHVQYPASVLSEVQRVLKPGGLLVGSTSQLEPYHSLQVWNSTLYGFRRLVEDAGLRLVEIRPSVDGITLAGVSPL